MTAEAIITRASTGQSAAFLLSLLVHAGVLPEMDAHAARFEHWSHRWLTTIEQPEDRLLLRRYCAWELLPPRSRTTVENGVRSGSRYQEMRASLTYCADLLTEIRSQGHTLMSFPQRLLDVHLTGSPSQRDALAPFTGWLRRHRLSKLRVESRRHRLEGRDYASEHRWQMARSFLSRTDMDPITRVGGLLVLLYGINLSRIAALKRSQVDATARPVRLAIATDPIELPDVLGEAVIQLLGASEHSSSEWLFPGRNPGRPLTPAPLSRRLRAEGLLAGSARVTALMELTRQMHPRVVSDLLGITPATAATWSRLAGSDWNEYPALR